MALVNNVTINGKINFEPNIYKTAKGNKMAKFTLNCYLGKDKDGKARYGNFMVKTFDNDMAQLVENVGKDAKVIVTGKLDIESYTNKEGKEVISQVIDAAVVSVMA